MFFYCGYISHSTGLPEGPGYAITKNGTQLVEGNFHKGRLWGKGRILNAQPSQDFMAYDYQVLCVEGTF